MLQVKNPHPQSRNEVSLQGPNRRDVVEENCGTELKVPSRLKIRNVHYKSSFVSSFSESDGTFCESNLYLVIANRDFGPYFNSSGYQQRHTFHRSHMDKT